MSSSNEEEAYKGPIQPYMFEPPKPNSAADVAANSSASSEDFGGRHLMDVTEWYAPMISASYFTWQLNLGKILI